MTTNITEKLQIEMSKCNACRLFNIKVKKANTILPNDVIMNILSYLKCKSCMRTLEIMNTRMRPDWTETEKSIWFFTQLNRFPLMKVINEKHANNKPYNPDYLVKKITSSNQNEYSRITENYRCLYCVLGLPLAHQERLFRYVEFMFSDKYKKLNYSNIFNDEFFKTMKNYLERKFDSHRVRFPYR